MKIRGNNNQSTASKLTDIAFTSLPSFRITGLAKDLVSIKVCPKSKGKAILLKYRKGIFRLTENLKVTEQNFTGDFIETETSRETETIIKASLANANEEIAEEVGCLTVV